MNVQPPLFESRYLGTKKFLAAVFTDDSYLDPKNVWLPTMMPKPSTVKWQLRDMYVFDNRRVPSLNRGYRYGDRGFTWTRNKSARYGSTSMIAI
jgi:hypothetical protein